MSRKNFIEFKENGPSDESARFFACGGLIYK